MSEVKPKPRTLVEARTSVRQAAARASTRAKTVLSMPNVYPEGSLTRELANDVEALGLVIDLLCDTIAEMEFHRPK